MSATATAPMKETPKPAPRPLFEPQLHPGKIVAFYAHASWSSIPVPAIVQRFDRHSGVCSLSVIPEHSLQIKPVGGVRHMEDNNLALMSEEVRNSTGGWDLMPHEKEAALELATRPNPHKLPPLK